MNEVCYLSGDFLRFHCPGCNCSHRIKINGDYKWDWNGDLVKPTVAPSILVRGTEPVTDEEIGRIMQGEVIEPRPLICHSYVREGQIEFLGDCTHQLAGTCHKLITSSY